MQPKFDIGDKVKTADGEVCQVVSYSFDGSTFTYKLSSREVDLRARKLIEGVKNVTQEEIEAAQE